MTEGTITIEKVEEKNACSLDNTSYFSGKGFWLFLLIAVSVHIIFAFGGQLIFTPDSTSYLTFAEKITQGKYDRLVTDTRVPGYPLLLSIISNTFGDGSGTALKTIQHLLGLAVQIMTYYIFCLLTKKKRLALLAGFASIFMFQYTFYLNAVLTEALYTFILMASLTATIIAIRRSSVGFFLLAVFTAGLLPVVRPVAAFMWGPLIGGWIFFNLNSSWNNHDNSSFTQKISTVVRSTFSLKSTGVYLLALLLFYIAASPLYMRRDKATEKTHGDSAKYVLWEGVMLRNLELEDDLELNNFLREFSSWRKKQEYIGLQRWRASHIALKFLTDSRKMEERDAKKWMGKIAVKMVRAQPKKYFRRTIGDTIRLLLYPDKSMLFVHEPKKYKPQYPWVRGQDKEFEMQNPAVDGFHGYHYGDSIKWLQPVWFKCKDIYISIAFREKWRICMVVLLGIGIIYTCVKLRHPGFGLIFLVLIYHLYLPMLIAPTVVRLRMPVESLLVGLIVCGAYTVTSPLYRHITWLHKE